MAVKAIIWDLDGTLVESISGIAEALNLSLTEHKLPTHSIEVIRNFIGDGSWFLCRRAAPNLTDEDVSLLNNSFKKHYQTTWKSGTVLYDGIHQLLEDCQLNQVKMAILSNKPHTFTVDIVTTLFPKISFDIIMGQQAGITQKPAPEGTYICLDKLGLSADQCLFIGDSTIDIQTAKAAGVASAAVTWGYHDLDKLKPENPDFFADSVKQLHNVIFN